MLLFREIFGWTLILVGMILIWFVFSLAINRQVLEAGALSFPSIIVFRSGIGFVRMTTAGRIAKQLAADSRVEDATP